MGLYFEQEREITEKIESFPYPRMRNTVTIESLIETHDQPFIVINQALKIVALNQSFEKCFEVSGKDLVGKPCCSALDHGGLVEHTKCRHLQFFHEIESYGYDDTKIASNESSNPIRIRGFPLIDGNGEIFLGESIVDSQSLMQARHNSDMVGRSSKFQSLLTELDQSASADPPVLLTGETGTGKELAAQYIHDNSSRRGGEFVVVDCTVLGGDLFENELFGHEKGAFTGAVTSKKGLFEIADHGTLFLDEVGELPLSQQPKLLRALESGCFRRVGGIKSLTSDVRVICATHRNLAELVEVGEFREDLYYRLSVFPIQLPPLRQRLTDISLLAENLLKKIRLSTRRDYRLTEKALGRLCSYSFPGNIRELRNILQLASALTQNGVIDVDQIHLRPKNDGLLQRQKALEFGSSAASLQTLRSPLEDVEVRYIQYLLNKHEGNRKKVAFEMSISERTLYRKLKRFNMNSKIDAGWQ